MSEQVKRKVWVIENEFSAPSEEEIPAEFTVTFFKTVVDALQHTADQPDLILLRHTSHYSMRDSEQLINWARSQGIFTIYGYKSGDKKKVGATLTSGPNISLQNLKEFLSLDGE